MGQVTVFAGAARRRRWSDEDKLRYVSEAFAPGAVVAEVARAADLSPSQIYRWRRDAGGGRDNSGFAAVAIIPDRHAAPAAAMMVEVGGMVVRIASDAPAKLVTAVLRSLAR